jgi:purine-binding chemotaxis protein CheW
MADETQYCTFYVGNQQFGLNVLEVQEVLRAQEMTPVPLAPSVVRGLINLRGQIVTALDLRRLLGLPDLPAGQSSVNVVVTTDDGPISLLADEVGDVLTVDESDFERPPDTVDGTARALIRGTCKLKDGLLLILDSHKIVTPDTGAARPARRAALPSPSGRTSALEHKP